MPAYRIATEFKGYLNNGKKVKPYLSLQLGFVHRKWESHDGYYLLQDPRSAYEYDSATIKSMIYLATLKTGMELVAGNHFFADIFLGLGLRHIVTKYEASGLNLIQSGDLQKRMPPAWKYDYPKTRFHATVGFRFAYAF